MKYLLSLLRHNKHTYSHIDTFEPSSCEIARLFLLFLGVQKNLIGGGICSRRNANFELCHR